MGKTMSKRLYELTFGSRERAAPAVFILLGIFLISAGCNPKPAQPSQRFHLHGKVVSVDVGDRSAAIDHDAIPGFMDAMTMSYSIPDEKALSTLKPGDEITADVVVIDTVPHLENVVVVKQAAKPDPDNSSSFHMPQAGDAVPDFALLDQNNKRISLRSYRGDALLVTFIYTRCPFPDFCPKVSDNFAQIYAALRNGSAPDSKVRLLTVSFDPVHDTPTVLRQYAASFRRITGTERPFDRWEFASVPKTELPKVAKFFGLYYSGQDDQIVHSVSTSLISPNGKIVAWFHDNNWQPQAILAQAVQSLTNPQQRNAKGTSVLTISTPAASKPRTP